jgi:hypothetical protein
VPNLGLIERILKLPTDKKKKTKAKRGHLNIQDVNTLKHYTINPEGTKFAMEGEANVSFERSCPWIINIYSDENDDENIMQFGDIIWLQHIQDNAFITMNRNELDELIVSYQYVGSGETEQFQGNSNGMFQLEAADMKYGGPIEWGQAVRFRHLSMGKYLAINLDKTIDSKGTLLVFMTEFGETNSLF